MRRPLLIAGGSSFLAGSRRRIVEAQTEGEHVFRANVDAAAAIGAVGRQNHRPDALSFALECGTNHLRFGADFEAIHAVVASGSTGRRDA